MCTHMDPSVQCEVVVWAWQFPVAYRCWGVGWWLVAVVIEPVMVRIAAVLGMNVEAKIPGAGWCACPGGGERVRISLCVYVRGWVGPRKRRSDSGSGFVCLRFCSGGGAL